MMGDVSLFPAEPARTSAPTPAERHRSGAHPSAGDHAAQAGVGPGGGSTEDDPPPMDQPLPDGRYLNAELSWLDFNARVLALAEDPNGPLLERAKFIAIFARNFDEFYMVTVAGLKRRLQTGLPTRSADGLPLRDQLAAISDRTADLMARQSWCFAADVAPALAAAGVAIVRWTDLDGGERERMHDYFRDQVFPVLTPLAVDPAHPFPYISGLALNLAVVARDPDGTGPEFFARVKVPEQRAPPGAARPRSAPGPVPPVGRTDRGAPRCAVLRHEHPRAPRLPGHPQRRAGSR
jgi:polyphosphate kinase